MCIIRKLAWTVIFPCKAWPRLAVVSNNRGWLSARNSVLDGIGCSASALATDQTLFQLGYDVHFLH